MSMKLGRRDFKCDDLEQGCAQSQMFFSHYGHFPCKVLTVKYIVMKLRIKGSQYSHTHTHLSFIDQADQEGLQNVSQNK